MSEISYKATIDKAISDICTNWYASLMKGITKESNRSAESDLESLSSSGSETLSSQGQSSLTTSSKMLSST